MDTAAGNRYHLNCVSESEELRHGIHLTLVDTIVERLTMTYFSSSLYFDFCVAETSRPSLQRLVFAALKQVGCRNRSK